MSGVFNSWAGKLLSFCLVALALVFLVREVLAGGVDQLLAALVGLDFVVVLLGASVYGASLALLGYAWGRCAAWLAGEGTSCIGPAVRIYAVTTLAKYLPGNVFHYAGRQLAAVRCNWPQRAVAQATVYEIIFHVAVVGAMVFILLPMATLPAEVTAGGRYMLARLEEGVLLVVVLVLAVGILVCRSRLRRMIEDISGVLPSLLLLQTAFFVVSLLVHLWLASSMSLLANENTALLAVAFLTAWLAGFVVPGAPGGLGVREAILVAFLSAHLPTADVLAFALASRLVTTLGEIVFALGASLFVSLDRAVGRA